MNNGSKKELCKTEVRRRDVAFVLVRQRDVALKTEGRCFWKTEGRCFCEDRGTLLLSCEDRGTLLLS